MTLKNAINKLTRAGATMKQDSNGKHVAIFDRYRIEFFDNIDGERVYTPYLIRNGVDDDLQTDYFAGQFCSSFGMAIRLAKAL